MNKRIIAGLAVAACLVLVLALAGCLQQHDGVSPGTAIDTTAPVAPVGVVPAVTLSIVVPALASTSMHPGNPTGADPLPTIRAVTGATPTVTFGLILVNVGNAASPTTTLMQMVPVDASGSAQATFADVPAVTAVGDIHIEGGQYLGFADFHGTLDLIAGAPNRLMCAPKGSNLRQDILATVIEHVVVTPDLFALARAGMVAKLASASVDLDFTVATAYDDVLTIFRSLDVPKLQVVNPVVVAQQTVPAGGGTMVVASAGSPINGLEIRVGTDSFSAATSLSVSVSSVASISLDGNTRVNSPVITIDTGGSTASQPVYVRIPISANTNEFTMPFVVDPITGKLEALSLVGADATSIGVSVRNFQGSGVSASRRGSFRTKSGLLAGAVNMILCTRDVAALDATQFVPTNFLPGVNDCPFVNHGSYLAPQGHCDGQTLLSMWAFAHPVGGSRLWNRLSPPTPWQPSYTAWPSNRSHPGNWFVDPDAYRLASVLHADWSFGWLSTDLELVRSGWFQSGVSNDTLTMRAFKFAMLQTHEPQYLSILPSSGNDGHALAVYRIDAQGLWVADPNFPGDAGRHVPFANGHFGSYFSGANATAMTAGATEYTRFSFIGKEWKQTSDAIANWWHRYSSGAMPRPDYRLQVRNDNNEFIDYTDGFTTTSDTVRFSAVSNNWSEFAFWTFGPATWTVYTGGGTLPLQPGLNVLGVRIGARQSGAAAWDWIDFRWVKVNRQVPLSITRVVGDPVIGATTAQTFTVEGSGFQSGAQVRLVEPTFGIDAVKNTTYVDSGHLQASAVFGLDQTTWTVQVINPDNTTTTPYSFNVVGPGATVARLQDLRPATAWRMPIGGSTGSDLSKLSIDNVFTSTGYRKVRFNVTPGTTNGGTNAWYASVVWDTDKSLDYGWDTDQVGTYNTTNPLTVHPGEDWNLTLGSDSELIPTQPVSAIADGLVLYNGMAPANYGNVVVLAHRTANGEVVSSFYAHLNNPVPALTVGSAVSRGARLGDVGNSGPAGPAHLHFEIRKSSMVRVDSRTGAIVLANPVSSWPASISPSDGGRAFVEANYYDPSRFIKGNGNPDSVSIAGTGTGVGTASTVTLAPGVTMSFVPIPGGTFTMGSPDPDAAGFIGNGQVWPPHSVAVSAFAMGTTEVTQAQYQAVTGTNPSSWTYNSLCPVENVSWYDAVRFANALSVLGGLQPCYSNGSGSTTIADGATVRCNWSSGGFRLPTEAEWEYACRAGSTTVFYWGDSVDESTVSQYACCTTYAGSIYRNYTTDPVSARIANSWGLHDMSGNVWEWCWDWYEDSSNVDARINPRGPDAGSGRVIRGGAYYNPLSNCRSAYRTSSQIESRSPGTGFRLVKTP